MKKRFKRTLSVFLTLSMLLGATVFTNVSAMSAPDLTEVPLTGQGYSPMNSVAPSSSSPEMAMVYEAAAIGFAHYTDAKNDIQFKHDPNIRYSELLEENSFQLDFTDFVSSYELGNLQNLYDRLIEAEYSSEDVDFFIERWTVAFARMPLADIWWEVFTAGENMEAAFVPLLDRESLEDVRGMLAIAFDCYQEDIFDDFFEFLSDALSQTTFDMDYVEAEELYYDTEPWLNFEATLDEYWSLTSYSCEWTIASYLKNLAAMNGVFDELGMLQEATSIGLFDAMTTMFGASFHHDPSKTYSDFWSVITNETGIGVDFLALVLDYKCESPVEPSQRG